MKKHIYVTLGLAIMAVCLLDSCASAAPPVSYGYDQYANWGESEVVIMSPQNVGDLSVFVDEQLVQAMSPKDSVKIIVADGQHQIRVDWRARNGYGMPVPVKGEPVAIYAQSQVYTYNLSLPAWLIGTRTKLNQVSVVQLQ